MIRIAVRQDEQSAQFIVSGHANYAEPGQDIVCAGVSMLNNTLANLVRAWEEDGLVELMQVYPLDEPQHIFLVTRGDRAIGTAVSTIIAQYAQLAEQYPDNVSLDLLP